MHTKHAIRSIRDCLFTKLDVLNTVYYGLVSHFFHMEMTALISIQGEYLYCKKSSHIYCRLKAIYQLYTAPWEKKKSLPWYLLSTMLMQMYVGVEV
jgi:hypothetical protein